MQKNMKTRKTKKLRLRQGVKEVLGVALFYSLIVVGVIALNARMEQINGQTKSADVVAIQTAQTNR